VAQLGSEPWICASVTSQPGLRAHFIHQFSAGLAALGVLSPCGAGAPRGGEGGGAQGGPRAADLRGLDPPPGIRRFLPFSRALPTATFWLLCKLLFWVF
jgi:hypothetical protein